MNADQLYREAADYERDLDARYGTGVPPALVALCLLLRLAALTKGTS